MKNMYAIIYNALKIYLIFFRDLVGKREKKLSSYQQLSHCLEFGFVWFVLDSGGVLLVVISIHIKNMYQKHSHST